MPSSNTHFALGLISFFLALVFSQTLKWQVQPEFLIVGFFSAMLAAQFADVDSGQTKIAELVYSALLIGALAGIGYWWFYQKTIGIVFAALLIALLLAIILGLKHRGLTHSYQAALITAIPFYLVNPFLGLSWLLGYFSHLLPDGVSGRGKFL